MVDRERSAPRAKSASVCRSLAARSANSSRSRSRGSVELSRRRRASASSAGVNSNRVLLRPIPCQHLTSRGNSQHAASPRFRRGNLEATFTTRLTSQVDSSRFSLTTIRAAWVPVCRDTKIQTVSKGHHSNCWLVSGGRVVPRLRWSRLQSLHWAGIFSEEKSVNAVSKWWGAMTMFLL